MRIVFVDSYFYLALLNPKDAAHDHAIRVGTETKAKLVTTQWVLAEVGDAFADPRNRELFIGLMNSIRGGDNPEVIAATQSNFYQGFDLYTRRPDKGWSLTDCISFEVMHQRGITEALTGDRHFTQAGFIALLEAN